VRSELSLKRFSNAGSLNNAKATEHRNFDKVHREGKEDCRRNPSVTLISPLHPLKIITRAECFRFSDALIASTVLGDGTVGNRYSTLNVVRRTSTWSPLSKQADAP
jgi:hypothetical protein